MVRQLLDPPREPLDMCTRTPASFGAFKLQLPPGPPLEGAGPLPLLSLPWGPRRPAARLSSPAHGDAHGQTAPAHNQQPGLPSHGQHRRQKAVPHGGHGLPLYHVLSDAPPRLHRARPVGALLPASRRPGVLQRLRDGPQHVGLTDGAGRLRRAQAVDFGDVRRPDHRRADLPRPLGLRGVLRPHRLSHPHHCGQVAAADEGDKAPVPGQERVRPADRPRLLLRGPGPHVALLLRGLGLHLRPQLLPLRPGHVLHPAAAQGQQEGRKCRAPRQAGLLHPLLCLHLTARAGSKPRPTPSPACRERPVLPNPEERRSSSEPEASPGLREAQAGRFLRIHLLGLYWVLSTPLERRELSPFSSAKVLADGSVCGARSQRLSPPLLSSPQGPARRPRPCAPQVTCHLLALGNRSPRS
ncbi:protein myomaker isoform X1 [Moschus berezovskii]|uniref:protein myomaker isoform X1 n=1 Tax=Moschus berezovskii TaxID=68408 RepID=UPI00244534D4|nr:protein myomaker isoform X1 [Moschus berezovskii]XP_055255069.1 protein myomaker isoform X1 [Moschus berezovskii]